MFTDPWNSSLSSDPTERTQKATPPNFVIIKELGAVTERHIRDWNYPL